MPSIVHTGPQRRNENRRVSALHSRRSGSPIAAFIRKLTMRCGRFIFLRAWSYRRVSERNLERSRRDDRSSPS